MSEITTPLPAELQRLIQYEPDTGRLFWQSGLEAFTATHSRGYKTGRVLGVKMYAHRVIWAIQTGGWPEDEIDHINGDRADNRWINLRAAAHSQNMRNRPVFSNNTSGAKGVSWVSNRRKWCATIHVDSRKKDLGYFSDIEQAKAAYAAAAIKYHGEFQRTA